MKLFVVFKRAIYRHDCGGVFSTYEKAAAAARALIAGEGDDHHNYEVIPFDIDVITPQGIDDQDYVYKGNLSEPEPVLVLSRKGKEVIESE